MNSRETEIPVPWGIVAGKIWGSEKDPIVLVIHGIMDNAGSFDRLIPLLPNSFCYVCIDLPGHGKSSHFPAFFLAYTLNNIIVYKLLIQYFKREKYIILGHSYGGQIGFLFSQLYPEYVEKLIMLDTIYFFPTYNGQFIDNLREKFDNCVDLEKKMKNPQKRPTYTYDEALTKLQDNRRNGYITQAAAEALIPRSIAPLENGRYVFTMDQRMKFFINPNHDFRYILEIIKKNPPKCPVLILLGRENDLQQIYFKSVLTLLKKFTNIRIKNVEGHHDVHNNNPEVVSSHITKFLLSQKGKL